MKHTVCDVCEQPATVTYSVKELAVGVRPLILPGLESPGRCIDLCAEHDFIGRLLRGEKDA